jgi:hypothetical protein
MVGGDLFDEPHLLVGAAHPTVVVRVLLSGIHGVRVHRAEQLSAHGGEPSPRRDDVLQQRLLVL